MKVTFSINAHNIDALLQSINNSKRIILLFLWETHSNFLGSNWTHQYYNSNGQVKSGISKY